MSYITFRYPTNKKKGKKLTYRRYKSFEELFLTNNSVVREPFCSTQTLIEHFLYRAPLSQRKSLSRGLFI